MLTPASLLERLQPLSKVEGYPAARAFLQTPGTYLHESGSDGRVAAKMTRDVWSYRFERAKQGLIGPIPGLAHLVGALKNMPDDAILKGVIFENDRAISAFWFHDQIETPVGFVVCERTAAPEPTPL